MQPHWHDIAKQISQAAGKPFSPSQQHSVGGGCINSATVLSDGNQLYFVKTNQSRYLEMFAAEFDGLEEISASNTIAVPAPLCYGVGQKVAFIAMEALEIGSSSNKSLELLGQQLAAMHKTMQAEFGWFRTNTIGSTPQRNDLDSSWAKFWREHRLGYQLEIARQNGHGGQLQRRGDLLLSNMDAFLDHQPVASLLHGDLWSGNYSVLKSGEPVIYDPAVYYGDREADIAMTTLFGGFGSHFYDAYNESFPLDAGYSTRKTLYNLYHILNHLNLFGAGYLGQSLSMIDELLSEIH